MSWGINFKNLIYSVYELFQQINYDHLKLFHVISMLLILISMSEYIKYIFKNHYDCQNVKTQKTEGRGEKEKKS